MMKANADKEEDLRIVELRVANFMRVQAVRIRPQGTMVEITGKNDQGKTSTIGSIAWALGGKEFAEAMPLRKGEDHGEVFVDLGALRVTKTLSRHDGEVAAPKLTVEFRDGSRPRSPQLVLDELRGMLLDPIKFIRASGPERIRLVQSLIPEFDFDENAKKRKELYDERTIVNREHKRAVAARDSIKLPQGAKPDAVDVAALLALQQEQIAHNTLIDTKARNRANAERDIERLRNSAEMARATARDCDAKADALEAMLAGAGPLMSRTDTTLTSGKLLHAQEINAKRALFDDWEHKHNEAELLAHQSNALSNRIHELDEDKSEAIEGIKLPFKGLAIGAEDVELDGVPFDQVAFSIRLRAGAALSMASEPRLKIMLIREFGSLLDKDGKKLLEQLAADNGFQVWSEVCDAGPGEGRIVIEDGRIAPP